jgi:hypothetical protein
MPARPNHEPARLSTALLALLCACGDADPAVGDGGRDAGRARDEDGGPPDRPRSDGGSTRTDAAPIGTGDFDARCAAAGVLRCVGFDDDADIGRTWGAISGTLSGAATPELDVAEKASGRSSLRFTIPSNSGSDTSGSYWINFSDDLSVQFGENATFYVQ